MPTTRSEGEATAADRTGITLNGSGSALLTAIETVRMLPTNRAVFEQAKIVYVMEGDTEVETAWGTRRLPQGSALALGSGRWCRLRPLPFVRMWTLYVNETFLRTQMSWFLPDKERVRAGVHPHEWDGSPLVLHPGLTVLRTIEPLWRQMSVLHSGAHLPETVAIRTVELFTRAVEATLPALLIPEHDGDSFGAPVSSPINGRLTESTAIGHVGRAIHLLRQHIAEPWTVARLAQAVSVSRTHLTRLFVIQTGVAPMRFLTEMRLTEFTRLVEESDIPIATAAMDVGWADARVASAWFARRFGIAPSQYRVNPHPHRQDSSAGATRHAG